MLLSLYASCKRIQYFYSLNILFSPIFVIFYWYFIGVFIFWHAVNILFYVLCLAIYVVICGISVLFFSCNIRSFISDQIFQKSSGLLYSPPFSSRGHFPSVPFPCQLPTLALPRSTSERWTLICSCSSSSSSCPPTPTSSLGTGSSLDYFYFGWSSSGGCWLCLFLLSLKIPSQNIPIIFPIFSGLH